MRLMLLLCVCGRATLQDFARYGVVDQIDKHKLYRCIKQARGQHEAQLSAGLAHYELSGNSGADLLDLDAHDGDLIEVRATPRGRVAWGEAQQGQPPCTKPLSAAATCVKSGMRIAPPHAACRGRCRRSRCRRRRCPLAARRRRTRPRFEWWCASAPSTER
jgi:hypothetical protein